MSQGLLKERAERWEKLHGRFRSYTGWLILFTILSALLFDVIGAVFAVVMNATLGTDIQGSDIDAVAIVLPMLCMIVVGLSLFSHGVAGLVAMILWHKLGKVPVQHVFVAAMATVFISALSLTCIVGSIYDLIIDNIVD